MEQTTLSTPQDDLARLDHVIARVAPIQEGQSDLLLEHLQSARTYLLGAMPGEYEFSLRSAKETAAELTDASVQRSIMQDVSGLLEDAQTRARINRVPHPPTPRSEVHHTDPAKSALYRFFHGSGATLGVFYPTHYIFAAFPSLEKAQSAAVALRAAGYGDVLAASALETSQFFEELRVEVGIWGALMASISRFFGTEEVFADIDEREAHKGAGFLAVYCPKEDQADRILDIAAPFEPLVMQLYLPGGIRSLCAKKFPGPQGNHPDGE